jgi:hypothetical protein
MGFKGIPRGVGRLRGPAAAVCEDVMQILILRWARRPRGLLARRQIHALHLLGNAIYKACWRSLRRRALPNHAHRFAEVNRESL